MAVLVLTSLAPACGDGMADDRPLVVATTTILGDIAANVVGEDARLEVIMPRGADPHDFEASSRQVALIAEADLVVANGAGLEEGLDDVLESVASDGVRVLEVAITVDPLPFDDPDATQVDDQHGQDLDPHIWLDPLRMAVVAGRIADALDEIAASDGWRTRADRYADALRAADQGILAMLDTIPLDRRVLVTNHDALGYFAERYGFEIVGVVIPGGSTLAEPGSEELAALVALVDALDIPAIFADTTEPTVLADVIAAEADHAVAVVTLHTGSLGDPGSPADTLIGMLEENARLIVEALG